LIGIASKDHSVGHKGHDEEEEEDDRVTCSEVVEQLASCFRIHDGRAVLFSFFFFFLPLFFSPGIRKGKKEEKKEKGKGKEKGRKRKE
jgi:quinol-cytochrome oxidoreductase complex cytochrome b subunit